MACFQKHLKSTAICGIIFAGGLAIGWGVPNLCERLQRAYGERNRSAYFAGTATKVVVYGTQTCPYCAKGRAYLQDFHFALTHSQLAMNQDIPVYVALRRRMARAGIHQPSDLRKTP
ncbi:glutaredoxin family protein [Janthinobacterium sp. P210005]|uniref:glutaredoxin family protein n=1 Tax=Janthinobacterium sp. P210005 TaxID=3112938 RepID=UPI002E252BE7|nr:hypothetical protein [Janthinobacterium sp. P210005]